MEETNRFEEYKKKYPRTEYVYSNEISKHPDELYFGYPPLLVEDVPVVSVSALEIELIELYIAFPKLIQEDDEWWDEIAGDPRLELSGIFLYFYNLVNDLVTDNHRVSFQRLYEIHENKEIRDFIRELKIESEARKLIGDNSIYLDKARLQAHLCIERLGRYIEYKREHLL